MDDDGTPTLRVDVYFAILLWKAYDVGDNNIINAVVDLRCTILCFYYMFLCRLSIILKILVTTIELWSGQVKY